MIQMHDPDSVVSHSLMLNHVTHHIMRQHEP